MNIELIAGESYSNWKLRVAREAELAYLRPALAAAKGNVSECARQTRIDRKYLTELIAKHDLSQYVQSFRTGEPK
jgi:DNA-binding NtrC family response regulator